MGALAGGVTVIIAAASIVAMASLAALAQAVTPTAAEKAAPTVDGYLDKTGEKFFENENDKVGKPWLYVKVRDPETRALYAVRIVLKHGDGDTSYSMTRLLEDPRVAGKAKKK